MIISPVSCRWSMEATLANRRAAAGQALAHLGETLLSHILSTQAQEAQQGRSFKFEREQKGLDRAALNTQQDKMAEAQRLEARRAAFGAHPDMALRASLSGEEVPKEFVPTEAERTGEIAKGIEGATSPEGVPSYDALKIQQEAKGMTPGEFNGPIPNGNPFNPGSMMLNIPIGRSQRLQALALNRKKTLEESEQNKFLGSHPTPIGGGAMGVTTPSGSILPTTLTGTQEGVKKSDEAIAGNTPGANQARTASSQAAAQGDANVNWLEPPVFEKRLELARAGVPGGSITVSEQNRIQYLTNMASAHSRASALEAKGATIKPLSVGGASSAFGATALQTAGNLGVPYAKDVTEDDKAYASAAVDWANFIGKALSGTTVRPDERDTFIATMFGNSADAPDLRQQKAVARGVFLQALQAGSDGANERTGEIFGKMIKSGMFDLPGQPGSGFENFMKIFDTVDPTILIGMKKGLNGGR